MWKIAFFTLFYRTLKEMVTGSQGFRLRYFNTISVTVPKQHETHGEIKYMKLYMLIYSVMEVQVNKNNNLKHFEILVNNIPQFFADPTIKHNVW